MSIISSLTFVFNQQLQSKKEMWDFTVQQQWVCRQQHQVILTVLHSHVQSVHLSVQLPKSALNLCQDITGNYCVSKIVYCVTLYGWFPAGCDTIFFLLLLFLWVSVCNSFVLCVRWLLYCQTSYKNTVSRHDCCNMFLLSFNCLQNWMCGVWLLYWKLEVKCLFYVTLVSYSSVWDGPLCGMTPK